MPQPEPQKANYVAFFTLLLGCFVGYMSTNAVNSVVNKDRVFDGSRFDELKTWLEKFRREIHDRSDDHERKIERLFDRFRDDVRPNVVFPSPNPSPVDAFPTGRSDQ